MPLTRLQYDLGIDGKAMAKIRRVHSFLKEHQDWAYTGDELALEFGANFQVEGHSLAEVLELLADIGAADERMVNGKAYYAYEADVEGLN